MRAYSFPQFSFGRLFVPRFPRTAVGWIICVTSCSFLVQLLVGYPLIEYFGLLPRRVLLSGWVWQLFTYLLMHGGFTHIIFNMFCVWMFGRSLEQQWGRNLFFKYYLLTGLGAGVVAVLASPMSATPSIGASGAVYGLLVAYALAFPNAVIYLYFFLPIKAKYLAVMFGVIEFLASFNHNTGVANIAHFGGMLTGFVYLRHGWWVRNRFRTVVRSVHAFVAPRARLFRVRPQKAGASHTPIPDALTAEVNEILEKILVRGAASLSDRERQIMERYTQRSQRAARHSPQSHE